MRLSDSNTQKVTEMLSNDSILNKYLNFDNTAIFRATRELFANYSIITRVEFDHTHQILDITRTR